MIKQLVLVSLVVLVSGCGSLTPFASENFDFYTGINFVPAPKPFDEVQLTGPLGMLGISYKASDKTTVFCEHQSSLSDAELGMGLNGCGFKLKLN